MPFGGAGPMHAAALAEELGMERILCPRASGVLSALGLIASERRRDTARTVLLSGAELTAERIAAEVAELRESIAAGLPEAAPEATYELRYRGQAFELGVPGPPRPDPAELAERFAAEHERRYGYRDPDARDRAGQRAAGPGGAWTGAAAGGGAGGPPGALGAAGALRRSVDGGRGAPRRARGGHRRRRARACSSCPRPPWSCRRAGEREVDERGTICAARER